MWDKARNVCVVIVGVVLLWWAFSFFCGLRHAGSNRTAQPQVRPSAGPAVQKLPVRPGHGTVRRGTRKPPTGPECPDPDDLLQEDAKRYQER